MSNEKLVNDIMENFLQDCKKKTISREGRAEVIKTLLKTKNCSQRELAKQLGINYSTLHDWVSLRQNNTGQDLHISFTSLLRKLESIDPKTFTDWGRLKQIKEAIENLEKKKN